MLDFFNQGCKIRELLRILQTQFFINLYGVFWPTLLYVQVAASDSVTSSDSTRLVTVNFVNFGSVNIRPNTRYMLGRFLMKFSSKLAGFRAHFKFTRFRFRLCTCSSSRLSNQEKKSCLSRFFGVAFSSSLGNSISGLYVFVGLVG